MCNIYHRLTCKFMTKFIYVACALWDVKKYLMCVLSADDETLLSDVRRRCKSFRDSHEWLASMFNSVYK